MRTLPSRQMLCRCHVERMKSLHSLGPAFFILVVSVISCVRDHYLKDTSQPDWLVRFPMVKASLRAMDAITEYISKVHPDLGVQLDYYNVAGASKRGWTTWDVGAVDPNRYSNSNSEYITLLINCASLVWLL